MGALKIDCYCTETQMTNILNSIIYHINNSDDSDINDFDDLFGDVRVSVQFELYPNNIIIKTSEILDKDWDLLYEDTAVLTSRLNSYINDYNRENTELTIQSQQAIKDQLQYV